MNPKSNLLITSALLFVGTTVIAALPKPLSLTKLVDCKVFTNGPVGSNTALVRGTITVTLSTQLNKPNSVKGQLDIQLNQGARFSTTFPKQKVVGIYDDLTGAGSDEYATLMSNTNGKLETIYLNFTSPGLSYVEYESASYKMDCTSSKTVK